MKQKLEVLQAAYEYIEKLIDGINTCVNFYRVGDLGNAHQYILLIIDGLEWVINVIVGTQDVRKEVIEISNITDILNEIVEAMQNNDTTLIADLLEYEVLEQISKWKEKLQGEITV